MQFSIFLAFPLRKLLIRTVELMLYAGFIPWSESPWQICFSDVLGSGAYSTVYRGRHRFQGHLTSAIKVLGKSRLGNECGGHVGNWGHCIPHD